MIRRLVRDRRGASAVEFALVAPIFLVMLFGMIEGCRLLWTKQVLNTAVARTARCMAIGNASCNSTANAQSYMVTQALRWGITIQSSNVTPTANTSCNGLAGFASVSANVPFNSPVSRLLSLPASLTASACFPIAS